MFCETGPWILADQLYPFTFAHLLIPLLFDNLHVHKVLSCSLQAALIICSSRMKVLRFGEIPYIVILKEGKIQLPDTFVFKNSYWHKYLLTQQIRSIIIIQTRYVRFFMSFRL